MTHSRAEPEKAAPGFGVAVGLLAFATFVVVTTEFVVVGVLPAMADGLEMSLAEAGIYVTAFAFAAALVGPPLSMLANRYEPRLALAATSLLFAVGNLAVALVSVHAFVIAVRMVQGCALPVFVSVSIAAAARLAGAGREGWAMSLVNTGVVAATVLGIPAGVFLAEAAGWPWTFVGLALLGLLSAGLAAALFPRMGAARPVSFLEQVSLLRRPPLLANLLLAVILFAAMFAGYTYIAAFLAAAARLDGEAIAWMLMGFGAAGVGGNWVAGRIVDRHPLAATAAVAAALAVVMTAVGPLADSLVLLVVPIGLWGAAHTAAFVFCQTSTLVAAPEAPAFAMSLNISACNIGIGLGTLAGGRVVDHHGAGAVGYSGGMLAVLALAVALSLMAARPVRRQSR